MNSLSTELFHNIHYPGYHTLWLDNVDTSNINYGAFETAFDKVLNKHAKLKKKYVRANDAPFMTKALRKAVMLRTRLRNKYNQNRIAENWNNFRRQRNLCAKLFRTEKKRYYNNLDVKLITDNKKFWKTVKPLFSDKIKTQNKIVLVENDDVISDDRQIAEIFNNYFVTVTETLGIAENLDNVRSTEGIIDPVEKAIEKYANHPSIKTILTRFPVVAGFSFEHVTVSKIETEIKNLNSNKATTFGNIPPKLLKTNSDICAEPLQKIFNECVSKSQFPDELKAADVSSLFKKDVSTSKTNYRPISVLPTVSKIYERLMYKQMMEHMTAYLSDLLCGFRQGYNAQHALTRFLEKCKIYLDTGGKAGAVFMDLSKAFDCVKHDLLIAKLHAYGFNHDALTFLYSYLSDRQQRVKMNGSFSSKQKLNLGVPQGSVLGPLLFNIYLNDLLISVDDIEICNYADDTTLYTCDQNLQNVVERLEAGKRLFKSNKMVL